MQLGQTAPQGPDTAVYLLWAFGCLMAVAIAGLVFSVVHSLRRKG